MVVLCGCSVKRNNFFSRNYHQLTTRYNVYFNGDQALKSGIKNMENRHKEDYTNLLPVFVSNDEQTRGICSSDMDYAIEKAAKAIDKHSITTKPKRRKNKDSKNYQTFRKKKEFNNQLDKCYLLLGKAYFYKKKYTMANNTFRFIQRQYAEDEALMTEVSVWLFRCLTEMGRYEEAAQIMNRLDGSILKRKQREMVAAAKTDFYVRQGMYGQAIPEAERLIRDCKNMKRKPRYNFLLSQLYLKENQDKAAKLALKKATRFNFNYEMVFNARINMALAYQDGDAIVEKKLKRMLRDSRNEEFQDRIYYALANIENKRGNEEEAIDLYWKSVHASVNNDNQQALSFAKLGDYYFKNRTYIQAQACYDSCLLVMDSRYEDYEKLKSLLTDLTELVTNLSTIQTQDSLLRIAALPEGDRNRLIDDKISAIKELENLQKEQEQREQAERNFYSRNGMLSRGDAFLQGNDGGDWYFYNPVTIALGKNDFKRKWGRRKLEDNWRRRNKASIGLADETDEALAEMTEGKSQVKDMKSREYYLQDLPLTPEMQQVSEKQIEEAYYKAGEIYLYRLNDPEKALECFDSYIQRFKNTANLPMVYYLAATTALKVGLPAEAERYKAELTALFPDSDFAKGIQDPNYFRQVEDVLKVVEKEYQKAYQYYQKVYYHEAEQICDRILKAYPDNKLKVNVLFLKAMCIVNTGSPQEAKNILEEVIASHPGKEIRQVTNDILASLSVGEKPVRYSEAEMAQTRLLQASRNWKFDEDVLSGRSQKEETTYTVGKEKEHWVVVLLPQEFTTIQETRFKARLKFINAAEMAEGKSYEMKKEEFGYKKEILVVRQFGQYVEASEYLHKIATDKFLLKILGNESYRMFAISPENFSILKRLNNIDQYVDFFTENYFEDRYQGEKLTGKWGTAVHVFNNEEQENHHFVLAVPFREVNTKRIVETLREVDPAFMLEKGDYDWDLELILVKHIGNKKQALDYMSAVLKNKKLFDLLVGIDYEVFLITANNLKAMQENEYLAEYLKFFDDHYLKSAGAIGVEDGDYIYNKSVAHKFVLFYPNTIDPYRLKTIFEEFNFAGLTLNNLKFDEEHDCMVVSGFNNKEEAMRYFTTVINNRKLFKSLKNVEYTNFIISEVNLQTLTSKKNITVYLEFFKKYYLN